MNRESAGDVPSRALMELLKEYLPILSHDIRTPMTAIRGATGLLSSGMIGRLTARQRKLIEICQRNVDLATLLVQDVVDLLRLRGGLAEVHLSRVDPIAEAHQAWEAMRTMTTIPVEIVHTDPEVFLIADRHYLRRVINALMRFPQGYAHVQRITFNIRALDDGVGITMQCAPFTDDVPAFTTMRNVRQVEGRSAVTGLELPLVEAACTFFAAKLLTEALPEQVFRVTILWPNASP